MRHTTFTGICVGGPKHGEAVTAEGDSFRVVLNDDIVSCRVSWLGGRVSQVEPVVTSTVMYKALTIPGYKSAHCYWLPQGDDIDELLAVFDKLLRADGGRAKTEQRSRWLIQQIIQVNGRRALFFMHDNKPVAFLLGVEPRFYGAHLLCELAYYWAGLPEEILQDVQDWFNSAGVGKEHHFRYAEQQPIQAIYTKIMNGEAV